MRYWVLLAAALTACESGSTLPLPYITHVSPSFWELDRPEINIAVSGRGFFRNARADVVEDTNPATTNEFSATLGGLPVVGIEWISNRLMTVTPPPLDAGTHMLEITTPLGAVARLEGAVRISGDILDLPRLTVNTTADENDIQSTPLPGTQGPLTSLREAILIASFLAAETYAIDFDSNVFPPDSPGVIRVAAGSDPLPPIRHAGVVIDGFGAGVVISGAATVGHGLTIRADDVWIRGITVRDFTEGHCVDVAQANRSRLTDNIFIGCDRMSQPLGAQVTITGGNGHQLIDNQVLDGGRDGIMLSDGSPTDTLLEGNTVSGNGDDGISIAGRGHIVRGNDIFGNLGNGIEAGSSEEIVVVGNRLRDNGDGSHGVGKQDQEHGIELTGVSRDWQIADNELTRSYTSGVHLGSSVARVTINRCDFHDNGVAPILGGSNAPTIESFNGVTLTGTSNRPGTIEVYRVDGTSHLFVASTPSDGAWSVALDPPLDAVAVTLTTGDGTSGMSAVHTP